MIGKVILPPAEAEQTVTETPGGTIDGVNKVFTTSAPYVAGKLTVLKNGLHEYDFTETNDTTFTMILAPSATSFMDVMRVTYTKKT